MFYYRVFYRLHQPESLLLSLGFKSPQFRRDDYIIAGNNLTVTADGLDCSFIGTIEKVTIELVEGVQEVQLWLESKRVDAESLITAKLLTEHGWKPLNETSKLYVLMEN